MTSTDSVRYDDIEPSLRTGDLFLFHGSDPNVSVPIEKITHSDFSHSAMVIRPDLAKPPLIWQAGPTPITGDVFSKSRHAGAQLSDLREAMVIMTNPKYGDSSYVRQLRFERSDAFETVAMWAVAGLDGTPFPSMLKMLLEYEAGQGNLVTTDRSFFCSELVSHTFMLLGLLPFDPPPNSYAPGHFSAQHADLQWMRGAALGPQLSLVPPTATREPAGA